MKTKTAPAQSCATCRWGKFGQWTNHKTPRPIRFGTCVWPFPVLTLPISIIGVYGYQPIGSVRRYIWPYDGSDCPVWERVEDEGAK